MNDSCEVLAPDGLVSSTALSGHGLINAVSTKALGNMSFSRDFDGTAPGNFGALLRKLGLDAGRETFLFPKLTHSSNVALVRAVPGRSGRVLIDQSSPEVVELARFAGIDPPADFIAAPETGMDACISDSPDCCLAILPADCAPVMLYDPASGYYALVHAGVLGALSGIVLNTVRCMERWCGTEPARLLCHIGPCVTSDFYDLRQSGLWNSVLKHHVAPAIAEHFELRTLIAEQLLSLGLARANIGSSRYCTGSDAELFFSNYSARTQEEKRLQGRHLALLGRADFAGEHERS